MNDAEKALELLMELQGRHWQVVALLPNMVVSDGVDKQRWEVIKVAGFYDEDIVLAMGDTPLEAVQNAVDSEENASD